VNDARSSTATGTTATAEAPPRPRRGRFAPSPTGPLHLGSLLAAVGSWVDARAHGGEWLLRIEDVDRARVQPGASDTIQHSLEAHGLHWDGPVLFQSTRDEAYRARLDVLLERSQAYPCSCSRGEAASASDRDGRYPGTCRRGPARRDGPLAIRLRTQGYPPIPAEDRVHGPYWQDVDAIVGDFVLRRRDGFWSYQLAVVVDDAEQGITDVVRGMDLYDNSPRQRLLQGILGLPMPSLLHLPLLLDEDGAKRSKSRQALPVDPAAAPRTLSRVLALLRHPPPSDLVGAPVATQLGWAVACWDPQRLKGVREVSDP
jgi:glutamyl-Q tRNA(Asp) synthetase